MDSPSKQYAPFTLVKSGKKDNKKGKKKPNEWLKILQDGNGHLNPNPNKLVEKHPDYSGYLKLDGRVWYMSAWVKEKNGKKFLSVSVKIDTDNNEPIPINEI